MSDREVHQKISELVAREKDLRDGGVANREELQRIEVALDQCWDLLRQRDALRAVGRNPGEAAVRPAAEVEGYRQ